MCFHNALSVKAQDLEHRYKAKFNKDSHFEPIYHGYAFGFMLWPVITNKNSKYIQEFNWGLIPSWVKTKNEAQKIRSCTFNAQVETAFEKPSFRNAIKTKRCLIPSTGFFEWQTIKSKKYPYFISLKEQQIFSMAGLWEEWIDKQTGEILQTFSILTTTANPLMEKIHNTKKRMPVILASELETEWLSQTLTNDNILALCQPYNENLMQAHTVSKLYFNRDKFLH
ncbi:MAG: hypothetical protein COX07_01530 [Bacteroidetes bacterium CG23_combo_of_CG06-09_8_20_14_all_32_9]|nr:MAG: hypothetical protein COX07_01530 [Bacteroidetes bacterium CG23_combo_of_CG06-09_8_20_14_all_32_9]